MPTSPPVVQPQPERAAGLLCALFTEFRQSAGELVAAGQAIAIDPISRTIAGAGAPPMMKRCVAIAATMVGMRRSAPNGASDGTSSASADPTSIAPVT